MPKRNTRILFVLDLDHTLIYGSYAPSESAQFLFQHNQYLKVYERPLARELVTQVEKVGDTMVYTSAKADYAKQIIKRLNISPLWIYTRKKCMLRNGRYRKELPDDIVKEYDQIVIIDDSPNVWLNNQDKITFLVPREFRGDAQDYYLQELILKID